MSTAHILITAGATRNFIDSMRCITANASGKTGVALANRFATMNCDVHILGSPLALAQQIHGPSTEEYSSTRDLLERMQQWVREHPNGIVIHSAAVGDFEMKETRTDKIKSGGNLILELQPTPKILDLLKLWSTNLFVVSFKAAGPQTTMEELQHIAHAQRIRSQSDIVFANVLAHTHADILLCTDKETRYHATRTAAIDDLLERITSQIHNS